jgi:branched-chain amino acid aminotransferase
MVKNGEVWTATGQYIMNGITRGKVIQVGRRAGLVVREKNFSLTDVYDADEAFVTGTFGGLTPVRAVDGRVIGAGGMGPITARLSELYATEIERYVQQAKKEGWHGI